MPESFYNRTEAPISKAATRGQTAMERDIKVLNRRKADYDRDHPLAPHVDKIEDALGAIRQHMNSGNNKSSEPDVLSPLGGGAK